MPAQASRLAVSLSLVASLWCIDAWACGGCFNMAPPPPPGQQSAQYVVQDAERVLFVVDPVTSKSIVWVEVKYTGAAEDFGWVLPLPKQPKVGVGSRWLFDGLDQRTAPVFTTTYSGLENCRDPYDGCVGGKAVPTPTYGGADASLAMDAAKASDSASGGGGGVTVLDQGQTGPYDYTVVAATDSGPLYTWLVTRGYKTPEAAKPILESHVKKGDVFVCIKLSNGKGVELVRPIVLEMAGAEPCVPLRLTSIAAAQEMTVSVMLGGPGRAIPKNTLHVEPNWGRINWYSAASNYPQVLAAAMDEAAGNAFSTEFSGDPAGIIDPLFMPKDLGSGVAQATNLAELAVALAQYKSGLFPGTIQSLEIVGDLDAFVGLGKKYGLSAAEAWGVLSSCATAWNSGITCSPYLPGKANTLSIKADEAKAFAVDGAGLAAALEKSFFGPIHSARSALQGSGKLTRLIMRISPEEMDRDPVFSFNAALPAVSNMHKASFKQVCSEGWLPADQSRLTIDGLGSWVFAALPPGSGGAVGNNAIDPRFAKAPAALRIELLDESGPAVVVDPSQAQLVSTAILGAVPGKPSLPKDLVLKSGEAWTPPPSNAAVTKLGVWHIPGQPCTPKPGWKDGQVPPTQPPVIGVDASAGEGDAISEVVATSPLADGGSKGGGTTAPPAPAGRADSSCAADPAGAPQSLWVALLALAGLTIRRAATRRQTDR